MVPVTVGGSTSNGVASDVPCQQVLSPQVTVRAEEPLEIRAPRQWVGEGRRAD